MLYKSMIWKIPIYRIKLIKMLLKFKLIMKRCLKNDRQPMGTDPTMEPQRPSSFAAYGALNCGSVSEYFPQFRDGGQFSLMPMGNVA